MKKVSNDLFIKNQNCESKSVEIEHVTKYGILGEDDVGRDFKYY